MLFIIETIFYKIYYFFYRIKNRCEIDYFHSKLGQLGKNAFLINPRVCTHPEKVFLSDNATILGGSSFIISENPGGCFFMKKNSGAAQDLTVITGNHQRVLGVPLKMVSASHNYDEDKDVIVEEDVWIGANVTLLSGVTIGRGATVGAGSVCFKSVPPYAIVMGNPAKVVGFNFTPEEIIEHEKEIYPEDERKSIGTLQKNYEKYFINRIKDIKQFTKL